MPAPLPTADLRLRGSARIRVTWPAAAAPPLAVYVGTGRDAVLCRELGAVVLGVPPMLAGAREALEWAADHGAELGAEPRRLILAGDHNAAALVAALARHARDRGWPRIDRTVLVSIPTGAPMTLQSYFSISRRVGAPRELVFQAWTDPELLGRWYRGVPFVYGEVDVPARIVFTTGGPDLEIVTLSVVDDHTVMTFEGAAPEAEVDAVERNWARMLDALAAAVDQGSQSGGNAAGMRPG